jgi:integrase
MRGQIIEKSKDVYLIRIETKKNGKRKTLFSKTVRGKKVDAHKLLTEKLSELDKGLFVASAKETLADYLTRWLETVTKFQVTESTFENYKLIVRVHIAPRIGEVRLSELRKADVQNFYNKMTADLTGARTVRLTHAVLHSALNEAVRLNMIPFNPASKSKLPKWTRKEITVLTAEQAKAFSKASKDALQGSALIFALETGMRPEEYLALKWTDLDLEKGAATVSRTLKRRKKDAENCTWYFGKPKTKRSWRTVPLSARLIQILKAHRRVQLEQKMLLGAAYQKHELVFATEIGTPFYIENLRNRDFKKTIKAIGLSENALTLYGLRHTCATLLLIAGINPKVVAERLGHTSVTMTLDTYSHVLPTMQETATEKLSSYLYG